MISERIILTTIEVTMGKYMVVVSVFMKISPGNNGILNPVLSTRPMITKTVPNNINKSDIFDYWSELSNFVEGYSPHSISCDDFRASIDWTS
jgi:hypothetical protein